MSQLWIYSTSAETLINLETACKKEDIDSLPFPPDKKYLELSKTEKIIQDDVLQYYIHLGKAISKKNDAGYPLHQTPTKPQLEAFGKTYCDSLNEIYAEDNNSWQIGEVIHTDTFISYQFGFGENGGLKENYPKDIEIDFTTLLENEESNKGVLYKRIIRYYDHVNGYDCVYLIKPNSLRYWLKSIALRDADDTFLDLKDAGY